MADHTEVPDLESSPSNEAEAPDSTNPTNAVDDAAAAVSSLSTNDPPPQPAEEQPAAAIVEDAPNDVAEIDEEIPDPEAVRAEFLALLPPSVHPRLDRLKSLHSQRDELLQRYQIERAALEVKYSDLMKPLYDERKKVVNGELDEVIVQDAKESAAMDEAAAIAAGGEGDEVKGVPQFWACAMGNMDVIAELIAEDDVDCLEFLTDITCADFPDGTGFELAFHFSENPYFTNPVLTKRYEVPNLLREDEPILKNVTGTTINWKPNQSLTFKKVSKKQRKKGGRGAGQIRTISKNERQESFFHFFSPPKMPELSEVLDEEEADAVEEAFDHDYDVAQAFRGCIIPKAVLWFTGEAMEEGYDEGMEGFIVDDEEEDGDDDDDEDDGGGGGGGVSAGQFQFKFDGGVGASAPPPGENGENPECKQS